MTDTTAFQPPSRVVLVATPHGRDWSALRDHLTGLGWRVDVFNPTPRGDAKHPEPTLPLLDGVELAVIVVTGSAPVDDPLNRRILLLAGQLKGALGDRKVIAFLEHDAAAVLAGSGIGEFRYERGNIDMLLPQVVSQLGQGPVQPAEPINPARARVVTPWLERFGIANGRISSEWLVALGVLAILAAIILAVGVELYDGSRGRLSAEVADTGGSATGDSTDLGSQRPSTGQLEPLGPVDVGSVLDLPARCVIETPKGAELGETIDCEEGVGGLFVGGNRGTWHNDIDAVDLELGVLGQAIMEPGSGNPDNGSVELVSGSVSDLASRGSAFGVSRLVLVFTANGQEVELRHRSGGVDDNATLTYRLDLG